MLKDIENTLEFIKKELQYPDQIVLESPAGPEVIVGGKKILMFGSYNYLGLANNRYIKAKAASVLRKYGVGSGGVRMLTGTMDIHQSLEKKIAALTDQEDAMTLPSGYGTNIGVIPALINLLGFGEIIGAQKAVIFSDEHNHASIIDGCALSEAQVIQYNHCDVHDLANKINQFKEYRKLIVTDGLFSMDGDIPPLPEIIDLARDHDAMVMVDDAHAFGVLGEGGAGSASHVGHPGQVDINMGAFSKGIGVLGGFVSAKKAVIEFLRVACRSYLFSDALSPMVVGAVSASLDFIKTHPRVLIDLQEKSYYFRKAIQNMGFSTLNSSAHVIPLLIGAPEKTIRFARELLIRGLFAPAIRWPAVAENVGRIRFAISASHSKEQLDKALSIVREVAKTSPPDMAVPPVTIVG